jgi:hypothetical protein
MVVHMMTWREVESSGLDMWQYGRMHGNDMVVKW